MLQFVVLLNKHPQVVIVNCTNRGLQTNTGAPREYRRSTYKYKGNIITHFFGEIQCYVK